MHLSLSPIDLRAVFPKLVGWRDLLLRGQAAGFRGIPVELVSACHEPLARRDLPSPSDGPLSPSCVLRHSRQPSGHGAPYAIGAPGPRPAAVPKETGRFEGQPSGL